MLLCVQWKRTCSQRRHGQLRVQLVVSAVGLIYMPARHHPHVKHVIAILPFVCWLSHVQAGQYS